jgi:hypothetical protein
VIVNTHLQISKVLFNYLSNRFDFKLNKFQFAYGNIKPDLFDREINEGHSLKESLFCLLDYIDSIIKDDSTIEAFSRALGIVCHYTCDYFCIYHNESHKKKNIIEHLMYEIYLHFIFRKMIHSKSLKLDLNKNIKDKDFISLFTCLSEKYLADKRSAVNDIKYSVSTAALVAENIICMALQSSSIDASISENQIPLLDVV